MHAFGHHLCVSLRLTDVRMAEHPRDVLNLGPIPEHPGGEGVAGEVGVQRYLNTSTHANRLQ